MLRALFFPFSVMHSFHQGWKEAGERNRCLHQDKALREKLKENQIDKMLKDSFPASDPPSVY